MDNLKQTSEQNSTKRGSIVFKGVCSMMHVKTALLHIHTLCEDNSSKVKMKSEYGKIYMIKPTYYIVYM